MKRQELMWIFVCFALSLFTADVWASPVPDTGQNKCYNAMVEIPCPLSGQPFYGQDANYRINPISYTKLDGSGNVLLDSATSWVMVKDNVTGLIWEMKTNKDGVKNYNDPHDADNTYDWYDSTTDINDFIKALNDANYGGYSDWRMPTINELDYIVNYSIPYPGPVIDTGYFPNTAVSWYWSSTASADDTDSAWFVSFNSGVVSDLGKSQSCYTRAVRVGQSGTSNYSVVYNGLSDYASTATGVYTDNGDGTVTETSTGLMWQQASSSTAKTWDQALAYCEGLNLGSYTDWRLPTTKELRSLLDYSRYNPAINTTYFPGTVSSFYWSSTTVAYSTLNAWGVNFYYGWNVYPEKLNGPYYVRTVRGGQAGSLDNLVISPASRNVPKDTGTTTFSVSNTGTGTMPWTAAVTSGAWLSITSGASGSNSGTITCSFTANTSTSARTATIRVTATGATGSPVDVTVIQAGSSGSLAASFSGSGLWIYNLHSATWMQITPTNPENMIYSGLTLYVDFGASYGLYEWDGDSWAQLTPANPENMVTSGTTLYVDFGASYGLYMWNGAAWTQLTSANPENMVASGSSLYVDFGASYGLYKWDGASWAQLTPANPENMAASASALYVDFGASYGLYKWDGTAWAQLSGSSPHIIAVSN
jgi:hypothetical protein